MHGNKIHVEFHVFSPIWRIFVALTSSYVPYLTYYFMNPCQGTDAGFSPLLIDLPTTLIQITDNILNCFLYFCIWLPYLYMVTIFWNGYPICICLPYLYMVTIFWIYGYILLGSGYPILSMVIQLFIWLPYCKYGYPSIPVEPYSSDVTLVIGWNPNILVKP